MRQSSEGSSKGRPQPSHPARRTLYRAAAATTLAATIVGTLAPSPAHATGITISGYIYRDLNNNGVRDVGEAGVAGIRVRHGGFRNSTATAADGSYLLRDVPASGNLVVETGWFRSQCPTLAAPSQTTCPSGPGPDNDFAVVNQFLRYPLAGAFSATNINAGLVPDWPGSTLAPTQLGGHVPANTVDVAARLSWAIGTCVAGSYRVCRIGDRFRLSGQIYNQGTTSLTGVQAKIVVPGTDCATALVLEPSATAPAITGMNLSPTMPAVTCATRIITVSFLGALVPGGAIRLRIEGVVRSGPGNPACVPGSLQPQTCALGEPQGHGWLLAVSHIDQAGDPDSTFCAAGDPRSCPTGIHDKRRAPDEIDPVGHNVLAPRAAGYDLRLGYRRLATIAVPRPGDVITVRTWALDAPNGAAADEIKPGAAVTLFFPRGTVITALPVAHPLLRCGAATLVDSVRATCAYRGPLSPGLSGPAIDVSVVIPATVPHNGFFRTVACLVPPAGQPGTDRLPAVPGCGLATTASVTTTDNDAVLMIRVG